MKAKVGKIPVKAPGAISKAIATRIKAARLQAGVTQEALGKALGISFQQVQKYERGVNRVAPDRLHVIAETVGKPITYFFLDATLPTASAADDELLAGIVKWMSSSVGARRILAALPHVRDVDSELVASLLERLE